MSGVAMNGAAMISAAMNSAAMNSASINSADLNSAAMNGAAARGVAMDGMAMAADGTILRWCIINAGAPGLNLELQSGSAQALRPRSAPTRWEQA